MRICEESFLDLWLSVAQQTGKLYSIGELATRTGISPGTIRAWERRYGRPVPQRLPSGHRRYADAELRFLRRVVEALARGHRPSKLLRLSEDEVAALLAKEPSSDVSSVAFPQILAAIRGFRSDALRAQLLDVFHELDPLDYVSEVIGPVLTLVGQEWAEGKLAIRHEHFLSETVEDVLRTQRLLIEHKREKQTDAPQSPVFLLATLPGERHRLGLQMLALTAAACHTRVHLLGSELPLSEIEESVRETKASILGLSISAASGGVQSDRQIRSLRATLPLELAIVAGGNGAQRDRGRVQGVKYCEDMRVLAQWLRPLVLDYQARQD